MPMFRVANDLTGWYASIIAAKKEKKLFTANSSDITNLPAKYIKAAIIIPVRVSMIGVALTKIKPIFFVLSLNLFIMFASFEFSFSSC